MVSLGRPGSLPRFLCTPHAAALLASSNTVVLKGIEIRPDVPAALAMAAGLWALAKADGGTTTPAERRTWFASSGLAFALALLFTQKVVLALPGIACATLVIVFSRRRREWKPALLD